MNSLNEFVPVAVATLVLNNGQLLLGRRLKHNQFTGWQCPGGYLQKGETIEQCARRHCLQKAGIEIDSLRPGPYSNNIFSSQQHTTTLYIIAEQHQVQNLNTFKNNSLQWGWFSFDHMPELLFLPLNRMLEQHDLSKL